MARTRRNTSPALEAFHPAVKRWFASRFETVTPPQAKGWPAIREGRDTLIAAPTGSGKTLSAFLNTIDALVRQGVDAPPPRPDPGALRLAPEGAEQRHSQEPQRAPGRHPRGAGGRWASSPPRSACWCAPATPRPPSAPPWSSAPRTSLSPRRSRCTSCSPPSAAGRCWRRCAPSSSTRSTPSPETGAAPTSP